MKAVSTASTGGAAGAGAGDGSADATEEGSGALVTAAGVSPGTLVSSLRQALQGTNAQPTRTPRTRSGRTEAGLDT